MQSNAGRELLSLLHACLKESDTRWNFSFSSITSFFMNDLAIEAAKCGRISFPLSIDMVGDNGRQKTTLQGVLCRHSTGYVSTSCLVRLVSELHGSITGLMSQPLTEVKPRLERSAVYISAAVLSAPLCTLASLKCVWSLVWRRKNGAASAWIADGRNNYWDFSDTLSLLAFKVELSASLLVLVMLVLKFSKFMVYLRKWQWLNLFMLEKWIGDITVLHFWYISDSLSLCSSKNKPCTQFSCRYGHVENVQNEATGLTARGKYFSMWMWSSSQVKAWH